MGFDEITPNPALARDLAPIVISAGHARVSFARLQRPNYVPITAGLIVQVNLSLNFVLGGSRRRGVGQRFYPELVNLRLRDWSKRGINSPSNPRLLKKAVGPTDFCTASWALALGV